MAKMRKVTVVRGYGAFVDPHHVQVEETTGNAQDKTGKTQTIRFKHCIIAAGSQAVRLPFLPDDPRIVDSTGALELRQTPEAHAGHRRRHHRAGDGHGLQHAGRTARRGGNARRPDAGRRPRPGQGLAEDERAALRQHHAQDQDRRRRGHGRGHQGQVRGRRRQGQRRRLRPGAAGGGPQPQRQEDRRRQGRRGGDRPRLHPGGHPDAHQRAAHLRHRRHRRPADAGAQGGARGACRGRGRPLATARRPSTRA